METVESSPGLRAKGYTRPLKYTTEDPLVGRPGPYRFIFDQGELQCSRAALRSDRICYVPRGLSTYLESKTLSFVYLDVGCWLDDADGKGKRRRDFGLVCGRHVYLCELVGGSFMSGVGVPPARALFAELARLGCGARVTRYAQARDLDPKSLGDEALYLLLGDLHLPPVTWFHQGMAAVAPPRHALPDWLAGTPAMARQKTARLRNHFERSADNQAAGKHQLGEAPTNPFVDIFGGAGQDLVHFLHALASVHPEVRQRLHFIHLGDMFELWMGRSYQFLPGAGGRPEWKSPGSPDLVADWALEVMMQNTLVFPALEQLERAGLAEVRYLGGNHDGYLMKPEVAGQLGIPTREPYLRALNADLLVEHGHRFDAPNFDNTQGSRLASGPTLTNIAYWLIPARSLEPWGRAVMGLISPRSRDTHMLGPALVHLDERFNQHQKPFSIYAMAHTHAPMLVRFEIGSKYTTTDHEEASRGRVLP